MKLRGQRRNRPQRVLRLMVLGTMSAMVISGLCYCFFQVDVIDELPGQSLCVFRALTGYPCPGCGMTRAMLSLGELRVLRALKFNLFSIPLFAAMVVYLIKGKVGLDKNRYITWVMLAAVFAFWGYRIYTACV